MGTIPAYGEVANPTVTTTHRVSSALNVPPPALGLPSVNDSVT
jgi:hypothetical protein